MLLKFIQFSCSLTAESMNLFTYDLSFEVISLQGISLSRAFCSERVSSEGLTKSDWLPVAQVLQTSWQSSNSSSLVASGTGGD